MPIAESPSGDEAPTSRARRVARRSTWVVPWAFVLGIVILFRTRPATAHALRELIGSAGTWAPVIYVALHASRALTWLPGSVLSGLGGLLFGFWAGFALTWIGTVITMAIGFALARRFRPHDTDGAVRVRFERLVARTGGREWLAVLVGRLVPGIPFNVISYLAGATNMHAPTYLAASAVGVLPRMAVAVGIGAGLPLAAP